MRFCSRDYRRQRLESGSAGRWEDRHECLAIEEAEKRSRDRKQVSAKRNERRKVRKNKRISGVRVQCTGNKRIEEEDGEEEEAEKMCKKAGVKEEEI